MKMNINKQIKEKITLAFPIGRQKLESRTSSETGKDSS